MSAPCPMISMDATNFTRYSFMTSFSTGADRHGLWPIIYGRSGKRKRSFISSARTTCSAMPWLTGLKQGLKEYYPEAQIVGEDYHKLFLTDLPPI